jgi:hypothetical protein
VNEPNEAPASGPTDLQFDRAEAREPGPTAVTCLQCGSQLTTAYYQINGKIVCEGCRHLVEGAFRGGSRLRRFARATGLGVVAGAIGAGLYFAVLALTGYEFGLIAIGVGWLVGGAVRKGARRRGGWFYQLLAMFLTYSAIVSAYVPPIYKAFVEEARKHSPVAKAAATSEPAEAATAPAAAPAAPAAPKLPGALLVVIAFALLFVLAFVAPFLAGLQNPIGLLIIGIGLYEAWKMNKRPRLEITGPHLIADPEPAPEGATPDGGA